jgi:hypothetical protein
VIVRRVSSPLSHNVRVLVVEDRVALADRIGAGVRDEWPLTGGFSNAADANGAFCPPLSARAEAAWSAPRGFWILSHRVPLSPGESRRPFPGSSVVESRGSLPVTGHEQFS